MNIETVYYFFSTGAQSAAGITALSATFAVIRSQNLALEIERRAKVAYTEYSHFALLTKALVKADTMNLLAAPTHAEKMDHLAAKFRPAMEASDPGKKLAELLAEASYTASPEDLEIASVRWTGWVRLVKRYLASQQKTAGMRRWTVTTTALGTLAVFTGVLGTGIRELADESLWAIAMDAYLVLLAASLLSSVLSVRAAFRAD